MIPRISLGKTNLMVSRIGCGLIRLGRKWGINAPGEAVLPDKAAAHTFLKGAVELGINFFDTAPAYGSSEAVLGGFLQENRALAQQLVIATKFGEYSRPDGSTFKDYSAAAVRSSVENSLRLFGLPILHLLQIHSITPEILANEETLRLLEDLQREGKVGSVGVTCSSPPQTVEKAIAMGLFSTIQVPYNLLNQSMGEVIRLAAEKGMGVIANRPLATGLLSSKLAFAKPEEQATVAQTLPGTDAESLSSRALSFVLGNPCVSVALTGTRNLDHLRENLS